MKERAFQRKCAKRISKIVALLLAVAMIATNFIGVPAKAYAEELAIHNITWGTGENDKILSWDPVEGAVEYSVYLGIEVTDTRNTSMDCTIMIKSTGSFTPTVEAYGEGGVVIARTQGPAKYFEVPQLATPSNIKVEYNVVTWDKVPNATEYQVRLYEVKDDELYSRSIEYYITTNRVKLSKLSTSMEVGATYCVKILARNGKGGFGNSETGSSANFIYEGQVLIPITNITWGTGDNDKVLSWDPVEGAVEYNVYLGEGVTGTYGTSMDCIRMITCTGSLIPTIKAYDQDKAVIAETQGPEKYFVVPQLATPSNIMVERGLITWDAIPNAVEYEVHLYEYLEDSDTLVSKGYKYVPTNSKEITEISTTVEEGKTYRVEVQAVNSEGFSNSESAFSENFVYEIRYDVNTSVVGEGGMISEGAVVKNHESYEVTLTPADGRVISYLKINGIDVTAAIVGNKYTISDITEEKNVEASFATCNHSWDDGVVTMEATCKEAGVRTYTCSVCHDTKTETIPKLNEHTWNDGVVVSEPDCGRTGLKKYTCTVCGATRDEVLAKTEIHTYGDFVVTVEETCGNLGIKEKTCTICGYKYEEGIPATGDHKFGAYVSNNDATLEADGTKTARCERCGAKNTVTDFGTRLKPEVTVNYAPNGISNDVKRVETVLAPEGSVVGAENNTNTKLMLSIDNKLSAMEFAKGQSFVSVLSKGEAKKAAAGVNSTIKFTATALESYAVGNPNSVIYAAIQKESNAKNIRTLFGFTMELTVKTGDFCERVITKANPEVRLQAKLKKSDQDILTLGGKIAVLHLYNGKLQKLETEYDAAIGTVSVPYMGRGIYEVVIEK